MLYLYFVYISSKNNYQVNTVIQALNATPPNPPHPSIVEDLTPVQK